MANSTTESTAPRIGRIVAKVIDERNGLETIGNVKAVRVRSGNYLLLIMEDYTPTIGEINGTVTFLLPGDERVYENIRGYFKCQYNEFTLIIKECQTTEKE